MFLAVLNYLYCSFYRLCSVSLELYSLFSLIIYIVHAVLPLGLDVGIVGVAAYYLSRLRKPNPDHVNTIFGHVHGSKEAEVTKQKEVRCIAHRGAGLDAPENTMEAFKYVSLFVSMNSW